jgi:hypothetical protein
VGGSYRTLPPTRHSTTHIELLREFLGVTIHVDESAESASCLVKISPPAPPLSKGGARDIVMERGGANHNPAIGNRPNESASPPLSS